jgi:hypothetical protein
MSSSIIPDLHTISDPHYPTDPAAMRTEKQKLRQTCDPCRKAKVKCNKQSSICSRCLASGASCDYGVSNRGGRWKNGQKLGVKHREGSDASSNNSNSLNLSSLQNFSPGEQTSPVLQFSHSDSTIPQWQDTTDIDMWACDSDPNAQHPPFQYESPPTSNTTYESSPSTSNAFSSSTSLSSMWPPELSADHDYPALLTPPLERPMACSCLVVMLQMLQNLHQNFPQSTSSQSTDLTFRSYASVLDMNEEAAACCTTMLLCPSCQAGDSSEFFIVLAALVRKVLTMTESWALSYPTTSSENDNGDRHSPFAERHNSFGECTSPFTQAAGPPVEQEDARRLKIEIALVGIRKMKGVLGILKQAGHNMRVDYERLTCTSLTIGLSARLKLAMDLLEGERGVKGN